MALRLGVAIVCIAGCYTGSTPQPGNTPFPQGSPQQVVAAGSANPNRVQLELDDEASLTAAGFKHIQSGTSTFARGMLAIDTIAYEEWSQQEGFVQQAANGPWAVEVRLALTAPCTKPGTGLWIHDGLHYVRLGITDHEVVLDNKRIDIGATSRLRTYRVELAGDDVTVRVDGNEVISKRASTALATVTLMFGVLGDGCPKNSSTWDYLAYETTPGPGALWPPRYDWHPGTKAQPLVDALTRELPTLTVPTLDDFDVPCLAIFALDGALRDVLATAYYAQGTPAATKDLLALPAMTNTHALGDAQRLLDDWTQVRRYPICDPAPGMRCPPPPPATPRAAVPAVAPGIRDAVLAAEKWSIHPSNAEQSTALAAKAYASALAAKAPGAREALARLQQRISSLAQHPNHCGL